MDGGYGHARSSIFIRIGGHISSKSLSKPTKSLKVFEHLEVAAGHSLVSFDVCMRVLQHVHGGNTSR